MRVISLVPAATEMVAELGAEASLVGISHECDWPPSVQHLPRATASAIHPGLPSGEIDAAVRRLHADGRAVIRVDAERVASLRPDLILIQDVCAVCAVVDGDVRALAEALNPAPALLALGARTLEGIFSDLAAVGRALDIADEAEELIGGLRYRLGRLTGPRLRPAPRVVCIEWLDPIYLAGHWVPELIAAAGGEDVGAAPGTHSRGVKPEELAALRPDLLLVAPCGFGLDRAAAEYRRFEATLSAEVRAPIWLLDGNAYTSRPGPRVVDGAVRIAAALRDEEMPGIRRARLGPPARR